jgi:hypothetical protein
MRAFLTFYYAGLEAPALQISHEQTSGFQRVRLSLVKDYIKKTAQRVENKNESFLIVYFGVWVITNSGAI